MRLVNIATLAPVTSFTQVGSMHSGTGTTSASVTFTSTAGNTLVALIAGKCTAESSITVAGGGNTWHTDNRSSSTMFVATSYALNIAGGSITVTATESGTPAFTSLVVYELNGNGGGSVVTFDKTQGDNNTSSAGVFNNNAVTALATTSDFAACIVSFATTGTITQATGYTLDVSGNLGTGSNRAAQSKFLAANSTTPSFTTTGGTGAWAAAFISIYLNVPANGAPNSPGGG